MERRKRTQATATIFAAMLPLAVASVPTLTSCSSDEGPTDNNAAGSGNGGAAQGGGTGGKGGTGAGGSGATSGSGSGKAGASAAGTGGAQAGTGGAAAGSGAAPTGGTAGASAGSAGESQAGSNATGGANAGGTAGSGPNGGAGGSGGAPTGTASFTVDVQLASEIDPDAPTTVGIVTWSIDKPGITSARIEFGLDTTYGMTAPVDLMETDYRTLLLGMKPERTYHFRVVATDGALSYTSEDQTVETGEATDLVSIQSFEVLDDVARERGFIVTSYWSGDGGSVPFVLDADGEIVWWFPNGPNGIARARMSADGKNMWMIAASNSGAPLQRVTMDGLDAQTYNGVVGSHDITPVTGATMAFLEYGETDCDSVYEIDPSGTTNEVFESQGVVAAGMCHSNAIRYSQAEDVYTFSEVSQDIFVVNRQGEVQWKLSDRVEMGNAAWGGVQHGHQLLENSIVVFANRGGGMSASSAVEYSLEGEELLNFVSGDFSQNLGDVQRLPGGNTLITYSNDSIIKEIDADENVVLEITGGSSRIGYALWTDSLYNALPDVTD